MGYFQNRTCKNCGGPIDRFVSTAFGDNVVAGDWTHESGTRECVSTTYAEPTD